MARKLPLSRQKEIIKGRLKEAQTLLEYLIDVRWESMCELMWERMETVGFDEYGDDTFKLSSIDLEVEVAQEIADAILYAAVQCEKAYLERLKELDKKR